MLGSLSIIVAQHMYSMPPYPFIATDYPTQLSLFTHHLWIGGAGLFFIIILLINISNLNILTQLLFIK